MSLSLFAEPPRVTINEPSVVGGSRNALLLGLDVEGTDVQGLICMEDGSVGLIHASYFTIDYRYQTETDRWIDVNADQPDQQG